MVVFRELHGPWTKRDSMPLIKSLPHPYDWVEAPRDRILAESSLLFAQLLKDAALSSGVNDLNALEQKFLADSFFASERKFVRKRIGRLLMTWLLVRGKSEEIAWSAYDSLWALGFDTSDELAEIGAHFVRMCFRRKWSDAGTAAASELFERFAHEHENGPRSRDTYRRFIVGQDLLDLISSSIPHKGNIFAAPHIKPLF